MNFQYETERLNIRILSSDFAGKTLEFHKNNRSTFEKYDGGKPENFYTLPYQKSLLQCEYQMMLQQKAIRFWLFEKGNPDHHYRYDEHSQYFPRYFPILSHWL